jgi:hypothetical protein
VSKQNYLDPERRRVAKLQRILELRFHRRFSYREAAAIGRGLVQLFIALGQACDEDLPSK